MKPKVLLLTIDGLPKVGYHRIKTDDLDQKVRLDVPKGYSVLVVVGVEGTTKTVKIVEKEQQLELPPPPPSTKLALSVNLKAIGVSIIANVKQRREDFYLHITNVQMNYHKNSGEDGVEVKVESVQMDNHIQGALFPVIFKGGKSEQMDNVLAFFHFSMARVASSGKAIIFRYLALQMLEFEIQVDRTTLEELLEFFGPMKLVSSEEAIALRSSHQWVNDFTRNLIESDPWGRIDIAQVNKSAQLSRIYFEQLHIHPFKMKLTFIQTPTEVKDVHMGFNILELLRDAVTIENAQIKLKSFLVEHAVESKHGITMIVGKHYVLQMTSQILPILGSLSAFGNPADLLSGVGTGVHDFFYEPFNGAVQSPKQFVDGLGKGTSSLLKHLVGGALQSIAGLGGGLSRGIAYLSFDAEYTTERDRRKIEERLKKGGIKEGFHQAGDSLVSGFVEGFSGVVTKPVTEAKKHGVGGFFAGVGMGLSGVLVKPVVGVTDATMSVIQGISNEVGNKEVSSPVRLRRALPVRADRGGFVLTNYSKKSADAQRLVREAAENSAFSFHHPTLPQGSSAPQDLYHSDVMVERYWVIFSEFRLLVLDPAQQRDHQILEWADIAYCSLEESGLKIHMMHDEPIFIPCQNEGLLYQLYAQFESEASKMTEPVKFVPLNDILSQKDRESHSVQKILSGIQSIEGYTFGAVNGKEIPTPPKKLTNLQLVESTKKKMLDEYKDGEWAQLDHIAWELISSFTHINKGLWMRNCLLVIIVNESPTAVQVHSVEMNDGRDFHVIPSASYDEASRNLQSKGSMIIFLWSKRVSIFHQGNISLNIDTSGFHSQLQLSNQASYQAQMGFKVTPLEASIENKQWNKFVFAVKTV